MKSKTTFAVACGITEKAAADCFDQTCALEGMEFDSLNWMTIEGKKVQVLSSAQRLFANRLRVPYSYLERCPAGLQAENLNYWLERERYKRESLFCRFDGNGLRAVFTDRYKCIDNTDIIRQLSASGLQGSTEVHFNLSSELFVLKIPCYDQIFDLSGDRHVPGVALANSEVGLVAFSIEAYIYRLVCTNGLIAKTAVNSRFRHVSLKALEEFESMVAGVIAESRNNRARLSLSAESRVDDPSGAVISLNRQFQLSKKEGEAVKRAWEYEQGYTMFHVISAYTRAAQDRTLDTTESYKLERVGGQILAMVKH
jgi:hypothetical protein